MLCGNRKPSFLQSLEARSSVCGSGRERDQAREAGSGPQSPAFLHPPNTQFMPILSVTELNTPTSTISKIQRRVSIQKTETRTDNLESMEQNKINEATKNSQRANTHWDCILEIQIQRRVWISYLCAKSWAQERSHLNKAGTCL